LEEKQTWFLLLRMPTEKAKQAKRKTAAVPEVAEAGEREKRKIRKRSLDLPGEDRDERPVVESQKKKKKSGSQADGSSLVDKGEKVKKLNKKGKKKKAAQLAQPAQESSAGEESDEDEAGTDDSDQTVVVAEKGGWDSLTTAQKSGLTAYMSFEEGATSAPSRESNLRAMSLAKKLVRDQGAEMACLEWQAFKESLELQVGGQRSAAASSAGRSVRAPSVQITGECFANPTRTLGLVDFRKEREGSKERTSDEESDEDEAQEDFSILASSWDRSCPELERLADALPDRKKLRARAEDHLAKRGTGLQGKSASEKREYIGFKVAEAYMLRVVEDAERIEKSIQRAAESDAGVARSVRSILRGSPGDPEYFKTGMGAGLLKHVHYELVRLEVQRSSGQKAWDDLEAEVMEKPRMSKAGTQLLTKIVKKPQLKGKGGSTWQSAQSKNVGASGGKAAARNSPDRSHLKCNKCKKYGHIKADCPEAGEAAGSKAPRKPGFKKN
jgi:hypothetical protein